MATATATKKTTTKATATSKKIATTRAAKIPAAPYGKLDPDFKRQWLKALRTPVDEGGYLQCHNQLIIEPSLSIDALTLEDELWQHNNKNYPKSDQFCCLGVATNLMVENGSFRWEQTFYNDGVTLAQMIELPQTVRLHIGLSDAAMDILIHLNDEEGYTFEQIADWIEANL